MSCKSERMREKLLLEQDLTLTKLVDICRNIRNQSNFKPKNWMTEIKKMFHQIENLQKIWKAKPGWASKSCYKCGEKYQNGHKDICKALGKTCYNCGKKFQKASHFKNKQNWKFRSKNLNKRGRWVRFSIRSFHVFTV